MMGCRGPERLMEQQSKTHAEPSKERLRKRRRTSSRRLRRNCKLLETRGPMSLRHSVKVKNIAPPTASLGHAPLERTERSVRTVTIQFRVVTLCMDLWRHIGNRGTLREGDSQWYSGLRDGQSLMMDESSTKIEVKHSETPEA